MKYLVLLLVIYSHIAASMVIDERKIDIWFGNGVWNDRDDARMGKTYLQNEIIKRYVTIGIPELEQKYLPLYLAYNQNDSAAIDLIETFYQMYNAGQMSSVKYFTMVDLVLEQGNIPEISGQEFAVVRQMMLDYVQQANSQTLEHIWNVSDGGIYNRSFKPSHRVLYISHSQGGLFANQLYENYIQPLGYAKYFANLQIATPASYVAARNGAIGEYVTNCIDPVINLLPNSLSCNASPGFGHTLIDSYLSIGVDSIVARGKIVDHIERMLVTLNALPSQWQIGSNNESTNVCEERRARLVHFENAVILTDEVFPFNISTNSDDRQVGKVYQVPDENNTSHYVIGSFDGTKILDVQDGTDNRCYELEGTSDFITIENSCADVTDGILEVDLSWKSPDINLTLSVIKDDTEVGDLDDIDGCPKEHWYIATEADVTAGEYYVHVTVENLANISETLLPETVKFHIDAPDGGINVSLEITTADLLDMGAVAKIIVSKPESGGVGVAVEVTERDDVEYTATRYQYDDEGNVYNYETVSLLNRVELGPIANAQIEIMSLSANDFGQVVYTGYTSSGNTLDTNGLILLPTTFKQSVANGGLYLISTTGGEDVDANDDLNLDTTPTTNFGTIHAIVSGDAIKQNGLKVNILTEIGYQVSKELLLNAEDTLGAVAILDEAAQALLNEDMNKDGVISHADLHAWVPSFDKKMLKFNYNNDIHPMVLKIYNADDIYDDVYDLLYPNTRPVADAGVDQSISFGESVTLDGSGSYDSDGEIVTYQWREDAVIHCQSDVPTCHVDGLIAGRHTFTLTVSDNSGAFAQDIVEVFVSGNATLISTFDTPGYANDITLSSDGTVAYVADYYKGGLQIVDISNPEAPTLIGSYNTGGYAESVALSADETIVYIANGYSGLLILDVTNPFAPFQVGKYYVSDYATDVSISVDGSVAYVSNGYKGLQVIDINNPAVPMLIGNCDTPDVAWSVTLSADGTVAYVADGRSGLQVVDVTNPTTPSLIGSSDTPGFAQSITLSKDGTMAYVADNSSGLQIVDISNPEVPLIIGSHDTSSTTVSVALSEDDTIAYVADWRSGLQIIDITKTTLPVLIGGYDTIGDASDVTLSADGRIAYIADRDSGLQIIDISTFVR